MFSLSLLLCGGVAILAGIVAVVYFLMNREGQSE